MTLEQIIENIARLIVIRRDADFATQKRIGAQLEVLYNFKYELLKGEN